MGVPELLGALASKGPVVLVIDDLHWAEPGLVSLVEGVCRLVARCSHPRRRLRPP